MLLHNETLPRKSLLFKFSIHMVICKMKSLILDILKYLRDRKNLTEERVLVLYNRIIFSDRRLFLPRCTFLLILRYAFSSYFEDVLFQNLK